MGNGPERDPGDDVVSPAQTELAEYAVDLRCRIVEKMKPRIRKRRFQVFKKLGVQFEGDEFRVRAHALEHPLGESADARSVFHNRAGLIPIDLLEHFINEET